MALDAGRRVGGFCVSAPVRHRLHSFLFDLELAEKNGVRFMEYIHGKQTSELDRATFVARLDGYREVLLDIGTGDGRFVQHMAQLDLQRFVIGVDACRENLRKVSRRSLPNALYLIANAEALPWELSGLASCITINFPWGSLLSGLLTSGSGVIGGLQKVAQPGARLEVRLNRSVLIQMGWSLEEGGAMMQQALEASGFDVELMLLLDAKALRDCPTTWAKRLAYGRDPYALCIRARYPGSMNFFSSFFVPDSRVVKPCD